MIFVIGGIFLLIATFVPPERIRYRIATYMSRVLLWGVGGRLQIEGVYPTDQAYIYMANHASFLDMFVLAAIMKDKFTGVIAEEATRYPFWNIITQRFRAIPIRRNDRDSAIASIQVAEDRLRRGIQVGIMPEGTRTLDGRLGPFKKGGFHMAFNTGAPILPIGIEGTLRLKPKTSLHLSPGPVIVRIGRPIPAEHYPCLTMEELIEQVRQQLLVLSGEVSTD